MTRKRKWDYTTDHQEQITTNLREGRVWNWGIRYSFNFTPEQSAASRARRMGKGLGPRPHTWKTGPDPELKHLRRRWLRAKNQARFWSQEWRLTWEQYRDTWVGHTDQLGRTMGSLNLVRRDTTRGWTVKNVHLMNRGEAMHRKTRGRKRPRPAGLGGGLHQRWRKR